MNVRNFAPLALRPIVAETESALERRFPRIARELMARWKGREIDSYLDSLLIDDRGDRMGFPEEVLEEIMFLAGVRWHQTRVVEPETMESPPDEFSFSQDAFRRCGTTGSWILI